MTVKKQTFVEKCYKDRDGNVVFYQYPNAPIIGWFIFTIIGKFVTQGTLSDVLSLIAFGCLFTWGWLELFSGVTYIRRLLGGLILIASVLTRI